MMKITKIFLLLFMSAALMGCGEKTTMGDLRGADPNTITLDRQGAWAAVSIKKLDSAARIAEAEAKKAEAERQRAWVARRANEQIIINTPESLEIYREIQKDKAFADMAAQNARIAEAAIKALRPPGEKSALDIPAQPKGKIAEIIDSTGDAVTKISDTPAMLAGVVGAAVSGAKSGDKYTVNGNDSNISGRDLAAPKTTTTSVVENITEEVN